MSIVLEKMRAIISPGQERTQDVATSSAYLTKCKLLEGFANYDELTAQCLDEPIRLWSESVSTWCGDISPWWQTSLEGELAWGDERAAKDDVVLAAGDLEQSAIVSMILRVFPSHAADVEEVAKKNMKSLEEDVRLLREVCASIPGKLDLLRECVEKAEAVVTQYTANMAVLEFLHSMLQKTSRRGRRCRRTGAAHQGERVDS